MLPITRTALIAIIFLMLPPALAAQESNRDRIKVEASKVLPNPELHIRRVTLRPGTEFVTIAFEARANVNAIVEVSGSGMAKKSARASGDPPRGKYQVTITGLKSATRYDYAIVVPSNDPRTPYRLTGHFTTERAAAVVAQRAPLTESAAYHIRNVRVEPTATKVAISFQGRPDQVPIVEIARRAPRPNLDGRLEVREELVGGYPMGGSPANGIYRIEVGDRVELEQGAEYHYLITVPSGSIRRPYQQAGKFRMQEQSVRVVLTAIEIRNDGRGGAGRELEFELCATLAGVQRTERSLACEAPFQSVLQVNGGRALKLRTGGIHRIKEEVVLERVPDSLSITMMARHDDQQSSGLLGWTPARRTFDLSRRPGLDPRPIDLMLVSENFHRGERLSFIVSGHVDIIRR